MQQVLVQIGGVSPLMMHNGRLSNPLDPYAKAIKEITSKRTKTDEDHLQIAKLEFLGGIYYDEKIGVYIPGENLDATIVNGAKRQRKGADVERGVMTLEDKVPLSYEGPRSPERLFDGGFADIRGVSSQGSKGGSRVMRCRPIFTTWGCTFTLGFDPLVINPDDLRRCVEDAGRLIGLCDHRPRFGKFQVDAWEVA